MTDIKIKTIFTIHSTLPFIHDPKNERFLVDSERILEDEPKHKHSTLIDDEDATPAPPEAISRPFLRITTDDLPKVPSEGFVFGRDSAASDILLETCANNDVSRKQFALQIVHNGEGSFLLKNFGRHGTTVGSAGDNRRITDQRVITPDQREFTVYIGDIQVRFELFDHSQHWDSWRQHWLIYCLKYDHAPSPPPPSASTLDIDRPWKTDYHAFREIGHGGEGTVYHVLHRPTAHVYAVKEYHGRRRRSPKTRAEHMLFNKLRRVKHDHIITYVERRNNPPAVVMEFIGGGNLGTVHGQNRLQGIEFKECVIQIASALDYLHHLPMAHRDLKPENIMVVSRQPIHIKLSDFGLATSSITSMKTFCGTLPYCAPELCGAKYTTKVDMWSLGILIYDFCYGLPDFKSDYTLSTWFAVIRTSLDKLLERSPAHRPAELMCNLLEQLPYYRPEARPTIEFCENIQWDAPGLADPDEVTDRNKASSMQVAGVSGTPSSEASTIGADETGHVNLFARRQRQFHIVK
ncbi:kinase-like domain-containing protein [Xylaria arbuscula]|nr:kinase-like domain-containing protein [Xylaria arbuscula]